MDPRIAQLRAEIKERRDKIAKIADENAGRSKGLINWQFEQRRMRMYQMRLAGHSRSDVAARFKVSMQTVTTLCHRESQRRIWKTQRDLDLINERLISDPALIDRLHSLFGKPDYV